jgi:dimethylglycine catabolism B
VTVFDLLITYIKEGRIRLDKSRFTERATYHDPCNYGRRAQKRFGRGYFEEPRWILDQCMENWVDLYPDKMDQICCGGGGGALTTGYNDERIFYARKKFDQIKATGAKMIVVPCHSCHGQLNNVKGKYDMEDLEVKYLWELVADCLIL